MRTILKTSSQGKKIAIVIPESDSDTDILRTWGNGLENHLWALQIQKKGTLYIEDLGPHSDVVQEPINIGSFSDDPRVKLISNFAHTPFELDGRTYASVEAFWQGLKFPDEEVRLEISKLYGYKAKEAGYESPAADTFHYMDEEIRKGTYEHWTLMKRACLAKFMQNEAARKALLRTGNRPLEHRTKRDSRTIPGVIMAEIWMKVRGRLRKNVGLDST